MAQGSIDALVEELSVVETTSKKFGIPLKEALFCHFYNPARMISKLVELGMDKEQIKELTRMYEQGIYKIVQNFMNLKKKGQNPSTDKVTICLHQIFFRYEPPGEGYGNCWECRYDPKNNPNCRGYHPLTTFGFFAEKLTH